MTYADAFHKIKVKLVNADTSSFDEDFAVQVTIKDEDAAGTFYVAYIGGDFSVEPYDYRDNSAAIDVTVDNFIKLVTGRIKADKALADGRIECFGDQAAVAKLAGIVKSAKKTAVKKETSKKETVKKEAVKKEAAKIEKPKKETVKKETKKTVSKKTTK